jgi:hypothetical protein
VVFKAVEKPRWVMGLEWPWHVRGTVWVVPEVMTLDSSCLWKAKSAMVGVGGGRRRSRCCCWWWWAEMLVGRYFVRRKS